MTYGGFIECGLTPGIRYLSRPGSGLAAMAIVVRYEKRLSWPQPCVLVSWAVLCFSDRIPSPDRIDGRDTPKQLPVTRIRVTRIEDGRKRTRIPKASAILDVSGFQKKTWPKRTLPSDPNARMLADLAGLD